ncbi:hypothetical protein DPMN_012775 [Dreissena polymorpha]|uniref:Uncharacterized protein n=1 Tax=Dreissena polymorpha TaxID=45954 RepID=A0A9D4S321_DREPO|nr:hypothetical protein DPMN_012775 [Dreissena polymorpha]
MLKLAQTDQQTNRQTNRPTDRQGKNNMSPTTIVGDKKTKIPLYFVIDSPRK